MLRVSLASECFLLEECVHNCSGNFGCYTKRDRLKGLIQVSAWPGKLSTVYVLETCWASLCCAPARRRVGACLPQIEMPKYGGVSVLVCHRERCPSTEVCRCLSASERDAQARRRVGACVHQRETHKHQGVTNSSHVLHCENLTSR